MSQHEALNQYFEAGPALTPNSLPAPAAVFSDLRVTIRPLSLAHFQDWSAVRFYIGSRFLGEMAMRNQDAEAFKAQYAPAPAPTEASDA